MGEIKKDEKEKKLREYQVELLHKVQERQSSILFLPAGSGKTFIALWLIKSMAADLQKSISNGGKRTFFLVNTAHLVEQQTKVIRKGGFDVAPLTGDLGVDYFTAETWKGLEKKFQVFVMTSQIYLNCLDHVFLKLQNANILIFDECHHATGNHPMKKIMDKYHETNPSQRPKVLGLSATLLNANIKITDFNKKLKELEDNFGGEILTSYECKIIREKYSAKPIETIMNVKKYEVPAALLDDLNSLCKTEENLIRAVVLGDNCTVLEIDEEQINVPGQNRSKLLRTTLNDIVTHVKEYGLYVGFIVCKLYIIQLYRYLYVNNEERYMDIIMCTITSVQIMRKYLYDELEKYGSVKEMKISEKTSTEKISILFDYLRNIGSSDRCLIFVKRKMTAKALYNIIKLYCESDSRASQVKVDFIVGSDNNPLRNTREGFVNKKAKQAVTKSFRKGDINVLVATNILEEGIDIQSCNIVIMFDVFETFRSYIQSKGRARMRGAQFITLNDVGPSIEHRVEEYQLLDQNLDTVIDRKCVVSDDDDDDDDDEDKEIPYTTRKNASIGGVGAVSLIYRYCSSLPSDMFTQLQPYWIYLKSNLSCKLKLPANAAIITTIKGPCRKSKKTAKRAAALEAVAQLHKVGALDDHLLPIKIPSALNDKVERDRWFPYWDGTTQSEKNEESTIKVPQFLINSRPLPGEKCYLHVIRTETKYDAPKIFRQLYCHELMVTNYYFGIITRNRLPSICEFPVYSDLGRIKIKIDTNVHEMEFDTAEIVQISVFHRSLFADVLQVVKKCFAYDTQGEANGYFIVPLKREKNKTFKLFWKVIQDKIENCVTKPTEEEIRDQEFSKEKYLGNVITPWYMKSDPTKFFIVINEDTNKHMESEFPETHFTTFADYYKKKYGLEATRPAQTLMEVRSITTLLDGISPRPVSVSEKNRKKTKKDLTTYLAPEFCQKMTFPGVFWYKSILLPSILHRLQYLLLAEEVRQMFVKEAKVGLLDLPNDKGDTEAYFIKPVPDTDVSTIPKVPRKFEGRRIAPKEEKGENKDAIPKDVDRVLRVKLDDIKQYAEYVEAPLNSSSTKKNTSGISKIHPDALQKNILYRIEFIKPPKLQTLKQYQVSYGPQAHEILEALTLKGATDVVNMERLETLGDSFLKYVASIFTYRECKEMNEGLLTILKGEMVSNQNLYFCAKKRNIPSCIKALRFTGREFWCPPGFSIPECLEKNVQDLNPISALLSVEIPAHERFSGNISVDTVETVVNKLKTHVMEIEAKDENLEKLAKFYLGKQTLFNKSISDTVEALIGVYLKTSGIKDALSVMKYFGILQHVNIDEINIGLPSPSVSGLDEKIDFLLPNYREIETIIDYKFRNKAYILQAFTHPSFSSNQITGCYQKLEFVGDAVLDFLITSYIFEYCGLLTPGQLTDLRSSLVNNTTFGAFTVRLGLPKYLMSHSRSLIDAMDSFLDYQEAENYEIHGNTMMRLINEEDTQVAEEVEVPKALGDIFESLAGAIYLDSGCQLDVVWRIYYNIMKNEINQFAKNIPINPVRALYEREANLQFTDFRLPKEDKGSEGLSGEYRGKICVVLRVTHDKKTRLYHGRGTNKKFAQRAAAKLALKDLNYNDFVI